MEIEKIKKANKLIEKLESIQQNLSDLSKSEAVDKVTIRRIQSGVREYSYEVELNDIVENREFLKTLKCLIVDHLTRIEKKLMHEIESL